MKIRENSWTGKSRWWPWLPHVLVAFWLLYLGFTIWQHALHSVQPPLYDALSYMQKAMNFWQTVEQGKFVNLLFIEPTVRPPGTILMSYPLGFSSDFHWFHFRSVFFPIICTVASVYIVADTARARTSRWWVAAIAFLFSSLPMFYHFDLIEDIHGTVTWGYVDNFQAGIAAMAVAATLRSLTTRSLRWLSFGALLAAFTLLVKPSGLMVMALTALTWLMIVAFERRQISRFQLPVSSFRAYVLRGIVSILLVYICVIAICVFSGYLSSSNLEFAKQVLAVMREMLQISFPQSLLLFHESSGEALLLWVIGVGVLSVCRLQAVREGHELILARVLVLLLVSLFIWGGGAWYWLVVQAGGGHIRYFYPFMLMGVVCMLPAALYVWSQANRLIRIILMAICFLPALNIAGLLMVGDTPPISWQKMAGVNISIGRDRQEVRQAYAFLAELRKANKNAQIYSFNGVLSQIFENVGTYEKMVRPEQPSFKSAIPIDWSRGFAVRVNELMDSDYILIRKRNQDVASRLAVKKFDSFDSESMAFEIWLSTLNEQSGIEIASDGRALRLLRIVDRTALTRAIDLFVAAHVWRPEFLAANQPIWWSDDTISAYTRNLAAEQIGFEGIYKLHALAISRINGGIKIEIWWEELRHEEANNQRYLFLHLIDSFGNILYNQQIALYPYQPPFENRSWRYGEVTFNLQLPNEKVASLAFGVYQPPGGFLLGDKGRTDWEGRRILIPITALSSTQPGAPVSMQR